jgi:BMFP domain-containing protein YqiC
VDERDGSQESDYPIRNLQTRRKLTLAVPVKDPAGRIKTKVLEILGPIAYMESSTSPTINPENLNRCFELYLDNSKAQTERIMAAQRRTRTLAGLAQDTRRDAAVRLHHNAQRLLRPLKVVAHFAEHLRFPAQWLRTRRDNERFLSLLEIVTFLHQHQRPVKTSPDGVDLPSVALAKEGYVETTLADYRMAYDLARTIFTQTLQDVSKPAKDLLEQIREMVRQETARLHIEAKDYWFTRRTVREHTRLPDYTIKRVIRELEDLEYLDVKRSAQGGSFRYRLATQHVALSNLDGLTTPEELAEKWDKWNTTGTTAKNEENARQ